MSTPPTTNSPTPAPAPRDTSGRDIIGEIDEMFSYVDYEDFCREAMQFIVDLTAARCSVLYRADQQGKMILQAQFMRQGNTLDPTFNADLDKLANYSRDTATSQKVTLTSGENKLAALAIPFMGALGPTVLILLLGPERAPFLEPTYGILSLYGAVMANYTSRIQFRKTREAFLQSTLLVDLYTKAATAPDYDSAAAVVASELQELLGCEHLALGIERKGRIRLDSISGRKKREKRTQGYSKLLNLMREIRSAESGVIWPPPEQSGIKALIASNQDELLNVFTVKNIVGVPLTPPKDNNEERRGAMVVMYRDQDKPTPEQFELISSMGPHLSALLILLSEGLPQGLRGRMRKFMRDNGLGKKVTAVLVPALLCATMFVPVPHHIRAGARLTPDISRQVAAPVGGILEDVFAKPGDIVEEDQLLAKLDGKEITTELARTIAEREVAGKRRDQARARKDVPETQLASYEYEALSKRVDFLRYQQNHLEIRSPITGLILSGDLERSKGVPVDTGQKLFEVAAFDKFVTEISVNDEDINWIEVGQDCVIRLESRGGKAFDSKVEQIYPVSEVDDGDNVFVCLGYIVDEDGSSFLRPGMRGRARIQAGWKPLWWVIFSKPWNYIKIRFF